jgi:hypothetical protein
MFRHFTAPTLVGSDTSSSAACRTLQSGSECVSVPPQTPVGTTKAHPGLGFHSLRFWPSQGFKVAPQTVKHLSKQWAEHLEEGYRFKLQMVSSPGAFSGSPGQQISGLPQPIARSYGWLAGWLFDCRLWDRCSHATAIRSGAAAGRRQDHQRNGAPVYPERKLSICWDPSSAAC